jgi:hypothetical protein
MVYPLAVEDLSVLKVVNDSRPHGNEISILVPFPLLFNWRILSTSWDLALEINSFDPERPGGTLGTLFKRGICLFTGRPLKLTSPSRFSSTSLHGARNFSLPRPTQAFIVSLSVLSLTATSVSLPPGPRQPSHLYLLYSFDHLTDRASSTLKPLYITDSGDRILFCRTVECCYWPAPVIQHDDEALVDMDRHLPLPGCC